MCTGYVRFRTQPALPSVRPCTSRDAFVEGEGPPHEVGEMGGGDGEHRRFGTVPNPRPFGGGPLAIGMYSVSGTCRRAGTLMRYCLDPKTVSDAVFMSNGRKGENIRKNTNCFVRLLAFQ